MLNAADTHFTLAEDGQIFYQALPNNPLPGVPIARLVKGEDVLAPKVAVGEAETLAGLDKVQVREKLEGWLTRHMGVVLEPLVALEDNEALKGAAKGIAFQVHEALGIVPRENLEDLIADLTPDDRRDLRGKNIRLGPILVFIPKLNKPAAVRLRGLLWGLYNDKALPMDCPKDGIVSFEVDPARVDKAFYQAIAYPVYGKRAIRIDMLDRVICAVYDGAKDGKFMAQHQMAEWLGSSIEGLYEVLEAMGHKKVFDPLEEKAKEEIGGEAPAAPTEDVPAVEDAPAADAKPAEQAKPELATFRLKKGKAFQKAQSDKPYKKPDKKPAAKFDDKKKGKRSKTEDRSPRIMSAQAKKIEDSPFAILQQLKQKSDG
jgi:ATP-dependent RNA helicase SUPV3L1/SUV3